MKRQNTIIQTYGGNMDSRKSQMNIGELLCYLLNCAYQDGVEDAAGYPLDVKKIAAVEDKTLNLRAIAKFVRLISQEYNRGCKERRKARTIHP